MSLSLLLIILLILFVIPAVLLPQNRIRFFSLSAAIPFAFLLLLVLISFFSGRENLENGFGETFVICYPFLRMNEELTATELNHLVSWFTFMILYLLLYLLSYLILRHVYVGSNPSIHRPTKIILRFFDTFCFLIVTFVPLFLFLVNIREVLILNDGIFEGFFRFLYSFEA